MKVSMTLEISGGDHESSPYAQKTTLRAMDDLNSPDAERHLAHVICELFQIQSRAVSDAFGFDFKACRKALDAGRAEQAKHAAAIQSLSKKGKGD